VTCLPVCALRTSGMPAGRESIRPEFVVPAGGSEQEQPAGTRLRNPRPSRQLGTNTDDTEFGNAARRPTLV
jgi:hypothetical protein